MILIMNYRLSFLKTRRRDLSLFLGYLKGRGGLFMGGCPKINAIDTEYLIATT